MTTESKGTLVVSLDFIERYDKALCQLQRNASPKYKRLYEAQQDALTTLRRGGTTVDMEAHKLAALAEALQSATKSLPEHPWQRAEREQERFYSEAQAVDADWTPAGGAA